MNFDAFKKLVCPLNENQVDEFLAFFLQKVHGDKFLLLESLYKIDDRIKQYMALYW